MTVEREKKIIAAYHTARDSLNESFEEFSARGEASRHEILKEFFNEVKQILEEK